MTQNRCWPTRGLSRERVSIVEDRGGGSNEELPRVVSSLAAGIRRLLASKCRPSKTLIDISANIDMLSAKARKDCCTAGAELRIMDGAVCPLSYRFSTHHRQPPHNRHTRLPPRGSHLGPWPIREALRNDRSYGDTNPPQRTGTHRIGR